MSASRSASSSSGWSAPASSRRSVPTLSGSAGSVPFVDEAVHSRGPQRWREIVGVVDEHELLRDAGQFQQPLDRGRAAHDREVVPVAARELVLPDELAQRRADP